MENNISFTGINGLYLGRKAACQLGTYVRNNGTLGRAEKDYTHISIKCSLTDDANGFDLTDFRNALKKCKGSFQARQVAQNSSDNIDFLVKRCETFDEVDGLINNSNFELNGVSILPNDRKVLPLFTYLAALTRKLKTLPGMSPERKKYIELSNKSIHEEAMKFIDNMV